MTREPTLYPLAAKNTRKPTGSPTSTPSALTNATHEDGGVFQKSCPSHGFLPRVYVDCHTVRSVDSWTSSFLRVKAISTVNYALSYQVDALGFNGNDDTPLKQAELPPLFIDIPSFIPDDSSDFSTFIVDQSSSDGSYQDRLVGVAIDGVPIYTALGDGGVDLLNMAGSYAVDTCGGTYGPTPHGIRYHYRTIPSCVLTPLNRGASPLGNRERRRRYIHSAHELLDSFEGTAAMDSPVVIGWALTGHPIFSPFTARGLHPHPGLDSCNGKFATNVAGLANVNNGSQTYGFYASPDFPYLVGCFGPGYYSLEQHESTLEAAAANLQKRKFDACPQGYVPNPAFASTGCTPCPAGKYSTASYDRPGASTTTRVLDVQTGCAKDCPVGSYCPPASTKPRKCPPGRYGNARNLGDASCSGQCEAGYFCPIASTTPRAFVCGNESVYCPEGSPDRIHVDVGFYSIPETSSRRTPSDASAPAASSASLDMDDSTRMGQLQCGPGTYCVLGLRLLCPAGTYGDTAGLYSPACTAPCPAGSYCPIGSSHPTLCPAGTFGSALGLVASTCSGLCIPGYWCPAGSTSPTQVPCAAGMFCRHT